MFVRYCDMSHDFSGNYCHFCISFSLEKHKNDDDVICCTQQACSLMSGEYDLQAGTSLQHHNAQIVCCDTFYLYQRITAPSIWIFAISIIFKLLFSPSVERKYCICRGFDQSVSGLSEPQNSLNRTFSERRLRGLCDWATNTGNSYHMYTHVQKDKVACKCTTHGYQSFCNIGKLQ